MTTMTGDLRGTEQRVSIWFENRALATYRADEKAAMGYAEAIGHRFSGLRVTVDPQVTADLRPLPCEQLWTSTP